MVVAVADTHTTLWYLFSGVSAISVAEMVMTDVQALSLCFWLAIAAGTPGPQ